MTEPLLVARQVRRFFENGQIAAVDGVDLEIAVGEYVSLVGKSGCGKSTLLNLLGGLDVPSAGQVLYRGTDLQELADLSEFRAQNLGFVFQSFHLVSVLTAIQNVQLPMFESKMRARERLARAAELLELVGVSHRAHQKANKLSGGERQRVAIARALANSPSLLLADEPTGNLDTRTAGEIVELFARLHQEGMTILMVTHDQSLANRAQRTVRMEDGRVVSS